jgi:hypothetical protein
MCLSLLYLFTVMAHCTTCCCLAFQPRRLFCLLLFVDIFTVVRLEAALGMGEVRSTRIFGEKALLKVKRG